MKGGNRLMPAFLGTYVGHVFTWGVSRFYLLPYDCFVSTGLSC